MERESSNAKWVEEVQRGFIPPERVAQLRQELLGRPGEFKNLEKELELNRWLQKLPDAPLASNFAHRVLDQIQLEERRLQRSRLGIPWIFRFLGSWRHATILALVCLGIICWRQIKVHERRLLAENLYAVSQAVAVPGIGNLQDFDAICLLKTPSQPSDIELIAALATP